MHGRPRSYKHKLKDPSAQESYKKKVDAIRNGTGLVLQCRKQQRYDPVVMDASAKLLKVVPEIYTIWNFRREALTPVFEAGGEPAQKASNTELALTQACLLENPKSYSTWHHRKWVVLKGMCNLEAELRLVSNALDADERNFHAWNYRQFVVRLMKRPLQEELLYSEDKVAQNFSNYSAWHYRSILLHRLHCTADGAGAEHASISAELQGLHVGTGADALSIQSAAPASSSHEADAETSNQQGVCSRQSRQGAVLSGGGGPEGCPGKAVLCCDHSFECPIRP